MHKLVQLLAPKLYSSSIADIDLELLKRNGIKCILIDLDNTILPWKDHDVPVESCDWIDRALQLGMKMCIASNTRNPRRLEQIAAGLNVPCLDKIAKPRRRGIRAAMEMIGGTPETTAMIGDQIFTDILGGNRLSLYTILVRPMHEREFIGTKFTRLVERPLIRWMNERGLLGTKDRHG